MAHVDLNFFPGFTRKSVSFTIDDGNFAMDKKFLDIVRPAGIKGTFNLNHADRATPDFYRELYSGYEIANHCKNHPIIFREGYDYKFSGELLDKENSDPAMVHNSKVEGVYYLHYSIYSPSYLKAAPPPRGWHAATDEDHFILFAEQTHKELEEVFGKGSVRQLAWPHGKQNAPKVVEYMKKMGYYGVRKTGDIRDTTGFSTPSDRYDFTYNASHTTLLDVMKLYEEYADDGELKFFCFGVHAVDFENGDRWGDLQTFADTYGNRPSDYYYASIGETFDYEDAIKSAVVRDDKITNPSSLPLYATVDGKRIIIQPKSTVSI